MASPVYTLTEATANPPQNSTILITGAARYALLLTLSFTSRPPHRLNNHRNPQRHRPSNRTLPPQASVQEQHYSTGQISHSTSHRRTDHISPLPILTLRHPRLALPTLRLRSWSRQILRHRPRLHQRRHFRNRRTNLDRRLRRRWPSPRTQPSDHRRRHSRRGRYLEISHASSPPSPQRPFFSFHRQNSRSKSRQ